MGFFVRLLDGLTTRERQEVTTENIALWEQRAPGWIIRCNKCGMEEPFGQYGVRRKAAGTKRNFGRCPQCRRWSWMVITKRQSQ